MAKKRTIRERIIAGLLAEGAQRTKRTSKSDVFLHPDFPGKNLYVGAIDSLRIGRTKDASVPAERLKAKLLEAQPE